MCPKQILHLDDFVPNKTSSFNTKPCQIIGNNKK